jgi:hypothetical protein
MNSTLLNKIRLYAEWHCEEHRDECDDVNLTTLEEEIRDHFEIDEEDFDNCDVSFIIWKHLDTKKVL